MLDASLRFQGIPVSSGVALGRAYVVERRPVDVESYEVAETDVEAEVTRFQDSVKMAGEEIRALRQRVAENIDERQASIFDAHLSMLSDPIIIDRTIEAIHSERRNAEFVFQRIVNEVSARLAQIQDDFFSQRGTDLQDVARRVLNNLLSLEGSKIDDLHDEVILVAHDLGASDAAQMTRGKILGFCTNLGGQTSHTAIMAKSLEIPAVLGLDNITKHVHNGDMLVLDGSTGTVLINPTPQELDRYRQRLEAWLRQKELLAKLRHVPAITLDGQRVAMFANIALPAEVEQVVEHGGEGIGLYRTEFIYLDRPHLPSEEEQYRVYSHVIEAMGPSAHIVFRTLDLGGDKFASAVPIEELNPFMGLRALRLCLENPDMFATQLRAMLRAAAGRAIQIMFPMVMGLEDLRKAKAFVLRVRDGLVEKGVEVPSLIKFGAMIEIPSAAITSDALAEEVDFFSIGTNDLIQYTLAVDRVNKRVAYLYEPLHPAVLRLIAQVVKSARDRGIPVAVCGEMAADPSTAAVLIGLGIRELSMGAVSIPNIKRIVRSVRMSDLEQMAGDLLQQPTAKKVRERLDHQLGSLLREHDIQTSAGEI